jgi:hypothetical protein
MQHLLHRWLYALLLGATLATQTLGLVHQVLHDAQDPGRPAVHGALDDAFSLDDDGVSCALFDQLAQGGAAPWHAPTLASALPVAVLPVASPLRSAGGAAGFLARAPPLA